MINLLISRRYCTPGPLRVKASPALPRSLSRDGSKARECAADVAMSGQKARVMSADLHKLVSEMRKFHQTLN